MTSFDNLESDKNMSADNKGRSDMTTVCASCGIAEIDEIKLKECDDCDLVRYCSDECREEQKSEHDEACKKRVAELRDELLFKQPESTHRGDCPICSLPLPLDISKATIYSCCSNSICNGCNIANTIREIETRRETLCPFCREPALTNGDARHVERRMKRVAADIPAALCHEGMVQFGKGDYSRAFEYWAKSAKLGNAEAHYNLSHLYCEGIGVEKDIAKEINHLEEAAIGGHPIARYNLGVFEWNNDNFERAVKHLIISSTLGHDKSIKALMKAFKKGFVEKDVLATTLRAHKAAVDATKSPQRREAEEIYEKWDKKA